MVACFTFNSTTEFNKFSAKYGLSPGDIMSTNVVSEHEEDASYHTIKIYAIVNINSMTRKRLESEGLLP